MALKDFLQDDLGLFNLSLSTPEDGRQMPKSNYVALALLPKGTITLGSSYTPPSGTATVVTGQNIVGFLKALAMAGTCWFFGNEVLNGKKGDPKEMEESKTYGTRTRKRPTGEITETAEFEYKHFFVNTEFFNKLRLNLRQWDIFLFTDKSVQQIRYDLHQPTFHGIGAPIAGNIEDEIFGKFSVSWNSETGELVPSLGVRERDLAMSDLKYTFAAPGAATGLVQVAGTTDRYTITGALAGNFTRAVNETSGAPRYQIFKDAVDAIPAAEPVAINTNTGRVDVGASLANGTYRYTVVAVNDAGIFGKYSFEIVKS